MSTLIAIPKESSLKVPPILLAAMCFKKAHDFKCDRIRVEYGGVRVAEFPIDTVGRFLTYHRLHMQPDRVAVPGRDWELHRPVWSMTPKEIS